MPNAVRRTIELVALALFFGLVAIYAARPIWDIDVFWQIVTGRIITETRAIPTTDILSSIEPEREWATLEWLYGLLVFQLERLGGLGLVRYTHTAVQWIAFVVFWASLRFRLRFSAITSFVLVALYVVLYADRFRERAHVFNLLFWTLLFPWLFDGPQKLDRTRIAVTAAVVFLWANLHSGGALVFLISSTCLPAAALIERWAGSSEQNRNLARAGLFLFSITIAAVLAPNFVRSSIHIVTLLGEVDVFIPEWRPTWHYLSVGTIPGHYFCGLFPSAWIVPVAWIVAGPIRALFEEGRHGFARTLEPLGLHRIGLALAMLVLSHRALRFVEFAVYAVVFTVPALKARLPIADRVKNPILAISAAALVAVGYHSRIMFLYGGSFGRAVRTAFGERPILEGKFPEAASDFLVLKRFEGGIFVQPKWGGYLLYRLWPKATVSSDGRGTFSKEAMQDHWATSSPHENFSTPTNGPTFEAVYGRSPNVDVVVAWHPAFPPGYTPERFTLVYHDQISEIWVRTDTQRGRAFIERTR